MTLTDAHQELMALVLKCFYKNAHAFHLTVPEIECLERTDTVYQYKKPFVPLLRAVVHTSTLKL